MADTNPTTTDPSEPTLDSLTWVEITQHTEQILARFENDETTFKRWEVKVVWEYWRGFEMMGLNPGVTVLKFMRDVVIPYASSRVHTRLQGLTRYEKATGADKSKTYKIETSIDEGPAVVYRKGSSPDTATLTKTEEEEETPKVAQSSVTAPTKPSNQPVQWDLGAHMRASAKATKPHSPHSHPEPADDDAKQSSSTNTSFKTASKEIQSATSSSSPAPFHNVPIAQAADNILKAPISRSKLITQGPASKDGFPATVTSQIEGHPDLIRICCNSKEEIVSSEDLVANNYLLRSTVESLNTTATSMQAIIEAQKERVEALCRSERFRRGPAASYIFQRSCP